MRLEAEDLPFTCDFSYDDAVVSNWRRIQEIGFNLEENSGDMTEWPSGHGVSTTYDKPVSFEEWWVGGLGTLVRGWFLGKMQGRGA